MLAKLLKYRPRFRKGKIDSSASVAANRLPSHWSGVTLEDMLTVPGMTVDDELKKKTSEAVGNPCATVYEWGDKLEDVKVTTYRGDDDVQDGRRIEGPTVFVYFRKKASVLPLFHLSTPLSCASSLGVRH